VVHTVEGPALRQDVVQRGAHDMDLLADAGQVARSDLQVVGGLCVSWFHTTLFETLLKR
jgi:hypothetical protein